MSLTIVRFLFLTTVLTAVTTVTPTRAEPTPQRPEPARCTALATADFSQIPDALTRVTDAKWIPATDGKPDYCEVSGYIAPSVRFKLQLPTGPWNHKFIELGCGGQCGNTEHIAQCRGPLSRGYACSVSDGGHESTPHDVKWAFNNPDAMAALKWASHATALAAKAIAQHYYGERPTRSYFMGCSRGGIEGMWEAESFPWDFDGIVAGAPALHGSEVFIGALWGNRALAGQDAQPLLSRDDLETLHHAVVAKCDLNDGIRDGLIGDPRQCDFQPNEIECTAERQSQCLSDEKIAAIAKIYRGPVTSRGEQIMPPTALRGSEQTWLSLYAGSESHPGGFYTYARDFFRYAAFQPSPGPRWTPEEFDFDRDYKRLGIAEMLEPVNPDLRRFAAAGGKLLTYTGWSDAAEGVLRTVDYYETAAKIMGPAATAKFYRLFVVPGMNHCGGGEGAFAIDYLSYLEDWVERARAPEVLLGAHPRHYDAADFDNANWNRAQLDPTHITFTGPIYPYPLRAHYRGKGDPDKLESFTAVKP